MQRADHSRSGTGTCIRSAADAVALFGPDFSRLMQESLRIAHLDDDNHVIALTARPGGDDHLLAAPGRIVRDAARHRTRRLILAHNHPSGDPTPSIEDHLATRRIAALLHSIEVELLDHLVFARSGIFSFRGAGLL